MKIDIEKTLSISKVNQNFSSAARMAEEQGLITILKNNKPKFVLMTFEEFEKHPRVIKHLGRDLITSPEVAIIELIKNSIDAKASHIALRLYNSMPSNELIPDCVSNFIPNKYRTSPILIVEDDGCGMTDYAVEITYSTRWERRHSSQRRER